MACFLNFPVSFRPCVGGCGPGTPLLAVDEQVPTDKWKLNGLDESRLNRVPIEVCNDGYRAPSAEFFEPDRDWLLHQGFEDVIQERPRINDGDWGRFPR